MLNFDYEPWNPKNDVLAEGVGTELGYGVIHVPIDVGKAPTKDAGNRDRSIGPSIDGVIELLAGAVEWCRWYGLSKAEVESRVRSYLKGRNGPTERALLAEYRAINEISDPRNVKHLLDPEKVVG